MDHAKISVWKQFYQRFTNINDSPQRIAAGFGVGIFFGILPGAGPLITMRCEARRVINKLSSL